MSPKRDTVLSLKSNGYIKQVEVKVRGDPKVLFSSMLALLRKGIKNWQFYTLVIYNAWAETVEYVARHVRSTVSHEKALHITTLSHT